MKTLLLALVGSVSSRAMLEKISTPSPSTSISILHFPRMPPALDGTSGQDLTSRFDLFDAPSRFRSDALAQFKMALSEYQFFAGESGVAQFWVVAG